MLFLKIALFLLLLTGFVYSALLAIPKIYAAVSTRRRERLAKTTKQSLKNDYVIELTNSALFVTDPNEVTRTISLNKITSITVETNDSGPWGEDVWFIIAGEDADEICVYPMGATNEDKALDYFLKLPGFVLKGMDSTSNKQFVCWTKPGDDLADKD